MLKIASRTHILLVEDDDAHAELVLLAMEDGRVINPVTRVASGDGAIDLLSDPASAAQFACVFLDVKLGRLSGLDVLRFMRSNDDPHVRKLPVVMLTTSSHEVDRLQAYELGVNSFVKKPLEFEAFQQVVQDLQMYWCIHNLGYD